jgi:hypothetical protein
MLYEQEMQRQLDALGDLTYRQVREMLPTIRAEWVAIDEAANGYFTSLPGETGRNNLKTQLDAFEAEVNQAYVPLDNVYPNSDGFKTFAFLMTRELNATVTGNETEQQAISEGWDEAYNRVVAMASKVEEVADTVVTAAEDAIDAAGSAAKGVGKTLENLPLILLGAAVLIGLVIFTQKDTIKRVAEKHI